MAHIFYKMRVEKTQASASRKQGGGALFQLSLNGSRRDFKTSPLTSFRHSFAQFFLGVFTRR